MNPYQFLSNFYNTPKQSNKLLELIKQDNVSLEQVLEEVDVAQEFKENKEYIRTFFTNERFSQLLDYLVLDIENIQEQKKAFKYPMVSADILSSATPQVLAFFSIQNKNGKYPNFEKLFEEFLKIKKSDTNYSINYTRGGYLYKVINSLIMNKPMIFANEIYNDPLLLKQFFIHSYSKSISSLLFSLIVNIQKNDSNIDPIQKKWLEQTQQIRKDIFIELLENFLLTSEKQELSHNHENLYGVLNSFFTTTFLLKNEYIQVIENVYMKMTAEKFRDTFFTIKYNRLGSFYLQILERMFQIGEGSEQKLVQLLDQIEIFFNVLKKCKLDNFQRVVMTTTQAQEFVLTNAKIIQELEILTLYLKQLVLYNKLEIIEKSNIESSIFNLLTDYPYNNILHYNIVQLIQQVIETKNENLLKIFFINNPSFDEILGKTVVNYQEWVKNPQIQINCYFGHIKNIFSMVKDIDICQQNKNKNWESFKVQFFDVEQDKEQRIFQEIDYECVDQYPAPFEFTIQALHIMYKDFLGLESGVVEESDVKKSDELENFENEDLEKEEIIENQDIDSVELREELTMVMNQEETAFQDLKYWKANNYYELDSLMKELNLSQQQF